MEDKKTGEREKHRSEWTATGVFYGSSIARDILLRGIFYRLRYRKSIALLIQSLDRPYALVTEILPMGRQSMK